MITQDGEAEFHGRCDGLTAKLATDAGLESECLHVGRFGGHDRIHLLEGSIELTAAHVERGKAEAQEGRVGVGRHRRLEGGERRLRVVLRERLFPASLIQQIVASFGQNMPQLAWSGKRRVLIANVQLF